MENQKGWFLYKYHGLGNDYLIYDENKDTKNLLGELNAHAIRILCDRHRGIGADGLLAGRLTTDHFHLRIFNSDGSEAEKSGNGLRIFARYLYDCGKVNRETFKIYLQSDAIECRVLGDEEGVLVHMGRAQFMSPHKTQASIHGQSYTLYGIDLGNPHCVIPVEVATKALAENIGPIVESHAFFPQKTNVQFVEFVDLGRVKAEIWERGSGYTLSSGSSACAIAALAKKLGWCAESIDVAMPGGVLSVKIEDTWDTTLIGPVAYIGAINPSCHLLRKTL